MRLLCRFPFLKYNEFWICIDLVLLFIGLVVGLTLWWWWTVINFYNLYRCQDLERLRHIFFSASELLLWLIILCHVYHSSVLSTIIFLRSMSQNVTCRQLTDWNMLQWLNQMHQSRFLSNCSCRSFSILSYLNKHLVVFRMPFVRLLFIFTVCSLLWGS